MTDVSEAPSAPGHDPPCGPMGSRPRGSADIVEPIDVGNMVQPWPRNEPRHPTGAEYRVGAGALVR